METKGIRDRIDYFLSLFKKGQITKSQCTEFICQDMSETMTDIIKTPKQQTVGSFILSDSDSNITINDKNKK